MIRRVLLASGAVLCLSWSAVAAEEGAALAARASVQLGEAAERLARAEGASDRIAALTAIVRAFESGLSALRSGLRATTLEQAAVRERLSGEDADLGDLLAMLQSVSRAAEADTLVHPGSAPARIRAGILTAAMVPALQERATALETDLRALDQLAAIRKAGIATLEDALAGVRSARLELAQAVSERRALPPPLATDEAALEALINSTETLAAFADSLASDTGAGAPDERWEMPVLGTVTRGFGDTDAAGIERPGWIIETTPLALVTAPVSATVRYAGPVPGHGEVAILEPSARTLLILAGLGEPLVQRGQVLSRGEPVGLMGGQDTSAQENLIETDAESGQLGRETLYMEVRQAEVAVDPADFVTQIGNKDRE